MKLVRPVMQLTLYGVLALMTKVAVAVLTCKTSSNWKFLLLRPTSVFVDYVCSAWPSAGINGVSPLKYFRKVWPVLTFAFTSRSSAASIPLNVESHKRVVWCS